MNGPGMAFDCPNKTACIYGKIVFWWKLLIPKLSNLLPMAKRVNCNDYTAKRRYAAAALRTKDLTRIIPEPCSCGALTAVERIKEERTICLFSKAS